MAWATVQFKSLEKVWSHAKSLKSRSSDQRDSELTRTILQIICLAFSLRQSLFSVRTLGECMIVHVIKSIEVFTETNRGEFTLYVRHSKSWKKLSSRLSKFVREVGNQTRRSYLVKPSLQRFTHCLRLSHIEKLMNDRVFSLRFWNLAFFRPRIRLMQFAWLGFWLKDVKELRRLWFWLSCRWHRFS